MTDFIYKGENLREVRFPLGGIGAGSVCIDGGARFVDWEIKNRPNADTYNGFTHIAVKAERNGELLDARALNGPLRTSFMGSGLHSFGGYGYGPARETMAGVPHFDDVSLKGHFPVAEYDFTGGFPAHAVLRAFSPFEPGNDFDSSLPLAMFEVTLENITNEPADYSVAFSVSNPNPNEPFNCICQKDKRTYALMQTAADKYAPDFGELCLMTEEASVSFQQNWFRGAWFDGLAVFWNDFKKPGKLQNRVLARGGDKETSVISAHFHAAAGESKTVRFALSWYYPNFEKYWGTPDLPKPVWRNWYSTVFAGAEEITRYAFINWDRIRESVGKFTKAMYGSSLPAEVVDAAASNLSVLKSPTCIRLADGSFYGWEGVHAREGSCEGSCQHVWTYQYALPMLFPGLERSMRELDYTYNLQADGSMPFRLMLPVGSPAWRHRSCADGLMGGVIKSYRDWKLCGDDGWLLKWWPKIKKSLEFTWSDKNPDRWDPERSGVLTGRQHHTLDMELFGPNSWLTGMYLTALEAASRMADAAGDADFARECKKIKEKGMKLAEDLLWNDEYEYYMQKIDLKAKTVLAPYRAHDPDIDKIYWNDEAGEIKYQIQSGVSVDQLLGQWHADLNGLGDVFDRNRVKKALASLFKYNFAEKIGDVFNPCRLYALEDESGLLICAYPSSADKPAIPIPYAEETMHGFEYAAACAMIQNGLEQEGLRCVRAVRDKYDGSRRNPWNEIECGGHYARSMAAWSLLTAYQGLSVDMTEHAVAFDKIGTAPNRRYSGIWAFSGAWGQIECKDGAFWLMCFGGGIGIKKIAFAGSGFAERASYNGKEIPFEINETNETNGTQLEFADLINITKDGVLKISVADH